MITCNKQLQHLAIIMDGNSRWAKSNGLLQIEGYKKGASIIEKLMPTAIENNIPYVTLYAFSTENWNRSKNDVSLLLKLFEHYLSNEINTLHKQGIRLKVIGRLDNISTNLKQKIQEATSLTSNNKQITLCIAFSYGSQYEIIDACKKIIDNKLDPNNLSIDEFKKYLYDPEMPDVDLLIRSGNNYRISNFLLWQSAYAELFFTPTYWPDFTPQVLQEAIDEYYKRQRTFGK